jgi:type VI secretion system secreted protein VgrG
LARAKYRQGCHVFRRSSIVEIISAALQNRTPSNDGPGGLIPFAGSFPAVRKDPDFTSYEEPTSYFRWVLVGPNASSLEDPEFREHLTQYNETDFHLVSRLLEEYGLTYFFEHAATATVMTITDRPGEVSLARWPRFIPLQGTTHATSSTAHEAVRVFKPARRKRSMAVTVRGYQPREPFRQVEAQAQKSDATAGVHFFNMGDGAGDTLERCQAAADRKLEGFDAAGSLADGQGNVRSLEPGRKFTLHDVSGLRDDMDLVVVRSETYATEQAPEGLALDGPFGFENGLADEGAAGVENRFQVFAASDPYEPQRETSEDKFDGLMEAEVTAEGASGSTPEIYANANGDVRIRFHWDKRQKKQNVDSSKWVPVSQYWAGRRYGALYTPRVGHIVLVAFKGGSLDSPVIVGRVYSDQNPAPHDAQKEPTKSTLKSKSSPNSDGFNEIRFEDKAGAEELYVHAQREFKKQVLGSSDTSIGGSESTSVGGDQKIFVKGNRKDHVVGKETRDIDVSTLTTTPYFKVKAERIVLEADTIELIGNQSIKLNLPLIELHSAANGGGASTLKVDNGEIRGETPSVSLTAKEGGALLQGAKDVMVTDGGDTYVKIEAKTSVTIIAGPSQILVDRGKIIEDAGQIFLAPLSP